MKSEIDRVRAEEQIAKRAAQQVCDPSLHKMVRPIVNHVAALAEALEVTQPVIPGIMIEVCCGQDHAGSPHQRRFLKIGPACRPAAAITPSMTARIEPTSLVRTLMQA